MRVVFDCGFLSLLLHPSAEPPNDPETQAPVINPQERIEYLIATLERDGAQIVIPAPVLAEFLVRALDAGAAYLSELNTNNTFKVEDFDQVAAIECATLEEQARANGGEKRGSSPEYWQKVKVDRQIVAIASKLKVACVYSDDRGIRALCADIGLKSMRVSECPLPPVIENPQMSLPEIATSLTSNDSEPPAAQSLSDEQAKDSQPAPAPPAALPADPTQQPPGSSLAVPPLPPSGK